MLKFTEYVPEIGLPTDGSGSESPVGVGVDSAAYSQLFRFLD